MVTILRMTASAQPFCHLRLHSEFAVVDGILRVDEVVKAGAKDGQVAMAIADLGNLFGAVKFYKAARKKGVKPLIGADCWLEPDGAQLPGTQQPPPARILLLVQNAQGYLNLCELISRAWLTNVVRNQACLKREWLTELNEGLICLSGFATGPMAMALEDAAKAALAAQALAQAFEGRFYVELQRVEGARHERLVRASCQLAAALGLPVVATHPVQFLTPEELTELLEGAGLEVVEIQGIAFSPLKGLHLSGNMVLNYILSARLES